MRGNEPSNRLCPKCGAYWGCDCWVEELAPVFDEGCDHDWVEAVGVEVDESLELEDAKVVLCRLCGSYAVTVETS